MTQAKRFDLTYVHEFFIFFLFVIISNLRFQAGLYIFELKKFQLVIDHDENDCSILNLVAFCCDWSRFLFKIDRTEKNSNFDEFFNFWLFLFFFFLLVSVDQKSTCAKKKKKWCEDLISHSSDWLHSKQSMPYSTKMYRKSELNWRKNSKREIKSHRN